MKVKKQPMTETGVKELEDLLEGYKTGKIDIDNLASRIWNAGYKHGKEEVGEVNAIVLGDGLNSSDDVKTKSNRWRLERQKERFVNNYPELGKVFKGSKITSKFDASEELLEAVKIARSEINYSPKSSWFDVYRGVKKAFKK